MTLKVHSDWSEIKQNSKHKVWNYSRTPGLADRVFPFIQNVDGMTPIGSPCLHNFSVKRPGCPHPMCSQQEKVVSGSQ